MPIEIKELHIKAVVGEKEKKTSTSPSILRSEEILKLKKEITKEVVEKVFRMLRQKNER